MAASLGTAVFTALLDKPLTDNRILLTSAVVPLAVACWLWRMLARDRRVLLGRRFLAFLIAYCLAFALLASSDALTWKRTLVGYEEKVPPNWLGFVLPPKLGDWHYLLAPETPAALDLLVVTLPSFDSKAVQRMAFENLIRIAVEEKARGIAFDYYFEGEVPVVDGLLCRQVEWAAAAGVPVMAGYRHVEVKGGDIERLEPPTTLKECFPLDRQGHLSSYVEPDGRLRMVPVFLKGDPKLPAFSLQIARALVDHEPALPPDGLIQFTRPGGRGIARLQGLPQGREREMLRDHFVLVGSDSETDRIATPFGTAQGVEVHAYAANNLRRGNFVRRLSPVWSFPSTFALCYLLAAVLARRGGWHVLLLLALGLSLGVVGVAALAMRVSLLWIDVSYPLVALWGLVGLLLVGGGALTRRSKEAPKAKHGPSEAEPVSRPDFDVFLSHNSRDKPAVRELADLLAARGLAPWLDEEELIPGCGWQNALEEIIHKARTAAVLVGGDGLGPWEMIEMRACLSQFVERGKRVIPVLLPGAPARPNLPLFLTQFTWVDLREGFSEAGLDRLVWGITGKKPASTRSTAPTP